MEVETLDLSRLLLRISLVWCVYTFISCIVYCMFCRSLGHAARVLYTVCFVGPLGMLLRSSKRLYMRIFYTLMEDKTCYFTLRTMNFTTMDEDKGLHKLPSYPTLEILREASCPGHVGGQKHFSPPTQPVYKANERETLVPYIHLTLFFFTHCQKTCYCVLQ